VITLGFCALVAYACLTRFDLPFAGDGGKLARAEFEAPNELDPGDPVRIRGIEVGQIEEIELNEATGTAVVAMRLQKDVALRRDARADIYWRTLLGGHMYVELEPGSPSAPELGDGVIPATRTNSQVEWDQFFQPYDGPTRHLQQTFFKEFRRGLADPDAVGRAIETLSPTLATVDRGLEPMRGRQSDDLRRLVASTARTTRGLAVDETRLAGLVEHAAATLAVTARRRAELGRMIELSPPAMDASVAALTHLTSTLDRLDPLAARLRPGARELAPAALAATPALREADAFLRESRPLLRQVGPLFESLERAGRRGVPLMRGLRPTLVRLDDELLPFLRRPDPETGYPTFQMIGPQAATVASAASEFDRDGHYLRFPDAANQRSVGDAPCQPFLTDPTAEEKLRCDALREVFPFPPPGGGGR
jgi:virulence factor Mce-like protein